ncbi:hypothetical protein HRbin01_00361 [archaeon HR01]|nr:hypothetical protein HRbin01_00361 [archaeon HR01]
MSFCLGASSILGLFFILYVAGSVPSWLFYTLVTGEAAFISAALATFKNLRYAYTFGLILAILTIAATAMSRAHIAFLALGRPVETLIIVAGDGLQILYIGLYLLSRRTPRHRQPSQLR